MCGRGTGTAVTANGATPLPGSRPSHRCLAGVSAPASKREVEQIAEQAVEPVGLLEHRLQQVPSLPSSCAASSWSRLVTGALVEASGVRRSWVTREQASRAGWSRTGEPCLLGFGALRVRVRSRFCLAAASSSRTRLVRSVAGPLRTTTTSETPATSSGRRAPPRGRQVRSADVVRAPRVLLGSRKRARYESCHREPAKSSRTRSRRSPDRTLVAR